MTDHYLTLSCDDLDVLRAGEPLLRMDNHGRQVAVFPQVEFEQATARPLMLTVVLGKKDLDLVELDPDGHTVADTTGTTGWQIQVGS